jgi:hypothetical protein
MPRLLVKSNTTVSRHTLKSHIIQVSASRVVRVRFYTDYLAQALTLYQLKGGGYSLVDSVLFEHEVDEHRDTDCGVDISRWPWVEDIA